MLGNVPAPIAVWARPIVDGGNYMAPRFEVEFADVLVNDDEGPLSQQQPERQPQSGRLAFLASLPSAQPSDRCRQGLEVFVEAQEVNVLVLDRTPALGY
jgi:hypothetical protein